MKKELFVKTLEALQKQDGLDEEISELYGKIFPDGNGCFFQRNDFLRDALINILEEEMNDTKKDELGETWITYFINELNYGRRANDLKVIFKKKEYRLSDAGILYDFIKMIKK